MNLNIKSGIHILGGMLVILSATFLVPACIAIVNKEIRSAGAFYLMFILVLVTGVIVRKLTDDAAGRLKVRDGFFVVTGSWLLFPVLGAFPYVISGVCPAYIDGLFEACSGFTTTGATIFDHVEDLPKSILFWRALTQWLGGFGVLALAGSLIPWLNRNRVNLTVESSSAQEKTDQQAATNTRIISLIYIGLTISMILLMLLKGCSLFESVCHAFSTVSTGGFSIHDDGIGHFGSGFIMIITMLFMFLAAGNYNTYIMTFKHGPSILRRNIEFRVYLILLLSASFILIINNTYRFGADGEVISESFFQVTSIITTTGFTAADIDVWSNSLKALLFLLLLIGGCMGSTAGGIKIYRIIILFKLLKRSFSIRLHPNAVIRIRISDKHITNDTVIKAISFFFLYILVIIVGVLLVSLDNFDFLATISSTASCLGNAGPAFGLAGTACTYSMFSGFSKFVLSFLMIAGRLELFTFLAVFTPLFWDPNR